MRYKPLSKAIGLTTLGSTNGVLEVNGWVLSGFLVGFLKSRHLFVGMTRKEFGLKT